MELWNNSVGDVLFWSTTLGSTELESGIASDIVMPRSPSFVKVSAQAYGLCEGAVMTFLGKAMPL